MTNAVEPYREALVNAGDPNVIRKCARELERSRQFRHAAAVWLLLLVIEPLDREAREGLASCLPRSGTPATLDQVRLMEIIEAGRIVLPPGNLDYLIEERRAGRPRKAATSEPVIHGWIEEQSSAKHFELFLDIFAVELLQSYSLDERTMKRINSLGRGRTDVARAKARGVPMKETHAPMFKITKELLDGLLPDSIFLSPPRRICEIGGAWGATINYFKSRFEIEEYQNYEIDPHYAAYAEEAFGAKPMPVDGETLTPTETESMDVVIANNVFFHPPALKILSYFSEMARVTRPGGIVLFNCLRFENLFQGQRLVLARMKGIFPRRSISMVPQSAIDFYFEDFERPTMHASSPHLGYFVYRKKADARVIRKPGKG